MPKKLFKKRRFLGFTLVEMLVIVSIIAILILAFLIILTPKSYSTAVARDAKRVTELNNIRNALQLYYMDKGVYPKSTAQENKWCFLEAKTGHNKCKGKILEKELNPYFSTLPGDPLFGKGKEPISTIVYSYQYISTSSGAGYKLHTDLETREPYEIGSFLGAPIVYVSPEELPPGIIPSGGAWGQWPMFGYDSKHSGRNPNASAGASSIPKWIFPTGEEVPLNGWITIGPDGTIYVGSGTIYHKVWALNPDDGSPKWPFPFDITDILVLGEWAQIRGYPLIDKNGNLYLFAERWGPGPENNLFVILDPNGNPIFQKKIDTGNDIINRPALDSDGNLYIGSENGNLWVFDSNLELKWKKDLADTPFSIPNAYYPAIGSDGTVYFGAGDGKLHAFDQDGDEESGWPYTVGTIKTSPVLSDNESVVYIQKYEGNLIAVKTSNGTKKWESSPNLTSGLSNATVGSDGIIYVLQDEVPRSPLRAIKDNNGNRKWQQDMGAFGTGGGSTPVIGGGLIYIHQILTLPAINYQTQARSTVDGSLAWFNPEKPAADPWWEVYGPVVADDGTVYSLDGDGQIWAYPAE